MILAKAQLDALDQEIKERTNAAFSSGYRAGLEEAHKEFRVMNYWTPTGGRWVDYGKWLDAKLKEQQP